MLLHKILEQTIPGLGFELVDAEITPAKIIRVFIDKEGGITVDDCALVSDHLSKLFVVEEIDYNRLEISSPGVERPLKKIEDFTRFSGEQIKIKVHHAVENQKTFQGRLNGINEDGKIILELAGNDTMLIDFTEINRARLIFEIKKGVKK